MVFIGTLLSRAINYIKHRQQTVGYGYPVRTHIVWLELGHANHLLARQLNESRRLCVVGSFISNFRIFLVLICINFEYGTATLLVFIAT